MSTNIFMSDMDNSYFNAWVDVVAPVTSKRVCEWHVHKNWAMHFKDEQTLNQLKTIQFIGDKNLFEIEFKKFREAPENLQHARYLNYYSTTHLPEEWARCFINNGGPMTNMATENWLNKSNTTEVKRAWLC